MCQISSLYLHDEIQSETWKVMRQKTKNREDKAARIFSSLDIIVNIT